MTRTLTAFAMAALFLGLGMIGTSEAQDEVRRVEVRFSPGNTGASYSGTIQGYDTVEYVLAARAGQTMTVAMDTNNPSSYFNVFPPGAAQAIHIGSTYGNRFSGVLQQNGSYRVQVNMMRNAARRNERAEYTIRMTVTGGVPPTTAGRPGPDFADGNSGGPDRWTVSTSNGGALSVRAGPGTRYFTVGSLRQGTVVRNRGCETQQATRWCYVVGSGVQGWVVGEFLRESGSPGQLLPGVQPSPPQIAGGPSWSMVSTHTGSALSLRAGPGTLSTKISSIPHGTVIRNLGCRRLGAMQWCRVRYSGTDGWVAGQFLIESGPPGQARPVTPPRPAHDPSGPDYWIVHDVPANYLLNIRTGPSTKYDVLARLENGTRVRNPGSPDATTADDSGGAMDGSQKRRRK